MQKPAPKLTREESTKKNLEALDAVKVEIENIREGIEWCIAVINSPHLIESEVAGAKMKDVQTRLRELLGKLESLTGEEIKVDFPVIEKIKSDEDKYPWDGEDRPDLKMNH